MIDQQQQITTLREALREKIEQPRLSSDKIEQLLAMQDKALADSAELKPVSAPARKYGWQASVASLLLVVAVSIGWMNRPLDFSAAIAEEVTANHLKLKPMDIHVGSVEGLRRYFTQLDFSPVEPLWLRDQGLLSKMSLQGGRYCSVRGVAAAQLRFDTLATEGDADLLKVG